MSAEAIGADQLIARFAASVGKPKEARLYLELFRSQFPERFALIDARAISGDGARSALVADLIYLQTVGLTPIVLAADRDAMIGQSPSLAADAVDGPEEARRSCQQGRIPIGDDGASLEKWLATLRSRKVVVLTDGGLHRADGTPVSMVDITSERDELSVDGVLAPGHAARLAAACELLDAAPHRLTVSLTSALDLLHELFTVRGAGTLLRPGAIITTADGYDDRLRSALTTLLRAAFGREPLPVLFDRPTELLLIAGEDAAGLRGAAIVEPAEPAPYLSKFAVGPAARGEGIGRDLWRELARQAPRLFWRARPENPITEWYQRHSTGSHRIGPWTVYWRGLEPDELSAAIAFAADRPADFAG